MCKTKKTGLALGSGGARGFCHIGVLQALKENGIPIDYISGCSMGALVAACYCCGASIEEMHQTATDIKQSKIMDVSIRTGANNISRQGFIKGHKAMQIASKLIKDKHFEDLDIPLRITASNLSSGELIVYDSGPIIDAVRASISIPAVFKSPLDKDLNMLADGGLIERIPCRAVRDLGADIVIAVDALGPPSDSFEAKGIFSMADIIERSYLLLDWESTKYKLQEADLVITPDQGDRHIYRFKDNDFSIEQGRIKTLEMMPLIKKLVGID